ncbi:hypothetical protein YC2023_095749 [Brassica napus]
MYTAHIYLLIRKSKYDSQAHVIALVGNRGGRSGTRSGSGRIFWIFGYFGIEISIRPTSKDKASSSKPTSTTAFICAGSGEIELLEDGMCLSSWFELRSASVFLVGRFSTQISSCSRLAACDPSVRSSRSRIWVISNSGSLSELCIHRGLRWLRVEIFLGGELVLLLGGSSGGGAFALLKASIFRCDEVRLVGDMSSVQTALSLSEAALEVGVMSGPLALYEFSVQRVWRRQSLSLKLNDGIVGWFLCLVPPGYVDLGLYVCACDFWSGECSVGIPEAV